MIINGLMCDNPNCKKDNGQPKKVLWDAQAVKDDPRNMPDEFFRFSTWQPNYEEGPTLDTAPKVYQFCSFDCERRFKKDKLDPRSPRELAELAKANQEADAKKKPSPLTDTAIKPGGNA